MWGSIESKPYWGVIGDGGVRDADDCESGRRRGGVGGVRECRGELVQLDRDEL